MLDRTIVCDSDKLGVWTRVMCCCERTEEMRQLIETVETVEMVGL